MFPLNFQSKFSCAIQAYEKKNNKIVEVLPLFPVSVTYPMSDLGKLYCNIYHKCNQSLVIRPKHSYRKKSLQSQNLEDSEDG